MRRSRSGSFGILGGSAVAGLLVALSAVPALALHRESPGVTRITRTSSHKISPGNAWGNNLAFSSTEDLTHTGNSTRQIFLYSQFNYTCQNGWPNDVTIVSCPNPPKPFLVQVTNRPGDPDNPSVSTLQNDGTQWVVFDALGTFNNVAGGAAARRQIFMRNLLTQELRQVTNAATGDSTRPQVNITAGIVAFESTAALTLAPSPAGVSQIFLYERGQNLLRQLTFGAGPSRHAAINRDGTVIAFESTADLLGSGVDTGISQIFVARYDKAAHTATLQQLTHGDAASRNPNVSQIGSNVAFESDATNILPPGSGVPGGTQIYFTSPVTDPPPLTIQQLTYQSRFGDCTYPGIGPDGSARVAFICTGDVFENGTTGRRAFVLNTANQILYQLTGAGDVQGPLSMNLGIWWLALSTTSDLVGDGTACGYQDYVIDYMDELPDLAERQPKWFAAKSLGQLPPDVAGFGSGPDTTLIGQRNFRFLPGNGTIGSQAKISTPAAVTTVPLTNPGLLSLVLGAPDEFTGVASIKVRSQLTSFPPIPLAGVGSICLAAASDGVGTIDCPGGSAGGDLLVSQDHNTDDSDPVCLAGCREGAPCQGGLTGPHQQPCPVCVGGFCSVGSTNVGAACAANTDCIASAQCINSMYGTCNGFVTPTTSGVNPAGGMSLTMPIRLSLSQDPGLDGKVCTADDVYGVRNVSTVLRLTSGTASTAILDADNVAGASLLDTDAGVAIPCADLRSGVLQGGRLVGAMPLLDVPNIPTLHDAIIAMRIEPWLEPGACGAPCTTAADCDDGNLCNGTESCVNGVCVAGTTTITCDDGNPCNGVETCDPTTGACVAGTPCDDGDPCNGTETCDAVNGCVPGTPIVCTDGNACNGDETCDPTTGGCLPGTPPVCDDANPCNGVETCDPATGCVPGTPINCADGNACNGDETCDPATGNCLPGTPPNCDDGNPCTDDSCNSATGCFVVNNTAPCDDADACTTSDTCTGGACVGTLAVFCNDNDACNGVETCNPADGTCQPGIPLNCDDGNPCTDDACDPAVGCVNVPNAAPCDDGNACTSGDTCVAGVCAGPVTVVCDDGNVCNGLETCDPTEGCQPGLPLNCDDLNPCTDDSCDSAMGCFNVNNTAPCDDGNACTTGDVCSGGICTSLPTACDDGDACNGVETCDPGTGGCLPGTPPVCDDGNPCTDDLCDSAIGCFTINNTAPCDDGDACTTGDVCSGGACTATPTVCDDGDVCNGVETCDPGTGACLTGTPLACDDGNPCTDDLCNSVTGCFVVNNTAPCDDGDACTTGDVCSNGACSGGSFDPICQLQALGAAITNASAADIGGEGRRLRLARQVHRATVRITAGLQAQPPKRTRLLGKGLRLLNGVGKRITLWANKGKLSVPLGQELMALIQPVQSQIKVLMTSAP